MSDVPKRMNEGSLVRTRHTASGRAPTAPHRGSPGSTFQRKNKEGEYTQ
jgi:hypothetical protein